MEHKGEGLSFCKVVWKLSLYNTAVTTIGLMKYSIKCQVQLAYHSLLKIKCLEKKKKKNKSDFAEVPYLIAQLPDQKLVFSHDADMGFHLKGQSCLWKDLICK